MSVVIDFPTLVRARGKWRTMASINQAKFLGDIAGYVPIKLIADFIYEIGNSRMDVSFQIGICDEGLDVLPKCLPMVLLAGIRNFLKSVLFPVLKIAGLEISRQSIENMI
jgi:hypothetical protein